MIHRTPGRFGHLARFAVLICVVLLPSLCGCAIKRRPDQRRERIRSYFNDVLINDMDRRKGWDLLSALGDGGGRNYTAQLETIRKDLQRGFEADFKRWKAQEPVRLQQTESLLKTKSNPGERSFLEMMD